MHFIRQEDLGDGAWNDFFNLFNLLLDTRWILSRVSIHPG